VSSTFIPHGVSWAGPRVVRFTVENQTVVTELGADNSGCRRCKKPLLDGGRIWPVVTRRHHPPIGGKSLVWDGVNPSLGPKPPKPHYKFGLYHERCLPPNVTAALPGRSRLALADAKSSLSNQHESVFAGEQS
jgi:hypothetical protein